MLNENQIFWENLGKIKDSLLLDDQSFSKMLGLTLTEYVRHKTKGRFLPLSSVYELSEQLNFHFEDLLEEKFTLLYSGNEHSQELLPRYSFATYSEVQPIRNVVNFLEIHRGLRAKTNLTRKFQLTESFFSRENQKTNIHLISDIVTYLRNTYQFTDKEFMGMGQRTPFVTKTSFLNDKLTNPKSIADVMSIFIEECAEQFDKNFHYKISSMNNNVAIIEAVPRKNVLDELNLKQIEFGNETACITRMGVISSSTWFKYKKFIPVTKISSIHNNDKSNKYRLDLNSFR